MFAPRRIGSWGVAPLASIPGVRGDAIYTSNWSFARYWAEVVSRAQLDAFCAVNSEWKKSCSRQPSIRQFLDAIAIGLREKEFIQGNAHAAAQHVGRSLRFGLMRQAPVSPGVGSSVSKVWLQTWSDNRLNVEQVSVSLAAIHKAFRSVSMNGRLRPGPYLFGAVVDPDGVVRQLRLFTCFTDGECLVPVESGYEAAYCAQRRAEGTVLFKPMVSRDAELLVQRMGLLPDGEVADIRYRPDYVVFENLPQGQASRIVEVRGFKPGVLPSYDEEMRRKIQHYSTLPVSLQAEVVLGYSFPPVDFARMRRLDLKSVQLEWQGKRQS
jgi:hypothetical protein